MIGGRTLASGGSVDTFADGEPLPGSLEGTRYAIETVGGTATYAMMDLLDDTSVELAADEAIADRGHIDVVVNNAIMSTATMQTSFILDVDIAVPTRDADQLLRRTRADQARVALDARERRRPCHQPFGAFVLPQPSRAGSGWPATRLHRKQGGAQSRRRGSRASMASAAFSRSTSTLARA